MNYTIGNSQFLSDVKKLMNEKVYRTTRRVLNENGQDAACTYLESFIIGKVTPESIRNMVVQHVMRDRIFSR